MSEPDTPRRSLLDATVLRDVLRQLDGTDVDELEVSTDTARLYLRREPGKYAGAPTADRSRRTSREEGSPVTAPLTGVFYSRPSPDQPPFVALGDLVEAGQVVALIETMKLFNEVITDVGGEILTIVPAEGDLVEAGAPLLYIRPGVDGGEL